MSDGTNLEKNLLKLFAEARDHKLSPTSLKSKLATASKKWEAHPDAESVHEALTALIDNGHIAVTGGGKTGHHPRPKGSYRLSSAGKDHVKPQKPDASDAIIATQQAYILLQFLRVKQEKESSMSRSELNGKLKTKSAIENLEFIPDTAKATIDYHLDNLVRDKSLEEKRQGVSTIYTLTDEGRQALGAADQYDTVTFSFTGAALNTLLKAARQSSVKLDQEEPGSEVETSETTHHAPAQSHEVEPKQIHEYIAHLKADKYAGRDLIPIHEVRSLVAQHHGSHAASHPIFDRMLKQMRSEGDLEIIAIADSRDNPSAAPRRLDSRDERDFVLYRHRVITRQESVDADGASQPVSRKSAQHQRELSPGMGRP